MQHRYKGTKTRQYRCLTTVVLSHLTQGEGKLQSKELAKASCRHTRTQVRILSEKLHNPKLLVFKSLR